MMIVSTVDDFRAAGKVWRMHVHLCPMSTIAWANIARACMDGSSIQHYNMPPALHIASCHCMVSAIALSLGSAKL